MRQALDGEDGAIAQALSCPTCRGPSRLSLGAVEARQGERVATLDKAGARTATVKPDDVPGRVGVTVLCDRGHAFRVWLEPSLTGEVLLSQDPRTKPTAPL